MLVSAATNGLTVRQLVWLGADWRWLRLTDPLDANEASTVAQRRSIFLDSSPGRYIERLARLGVAQCRPLMAPRLAPQS